MGRKYDLHRKAKGSERSGAKRTAKRNVCTKINGDVEEMNDTKIESPLIPAASYELKIADGLVCVIHEDQRPPNWFHRFMVRLILGWNWKKL